MEDIPLTDNTLMLYAMKHYDNSQCMGIQEFQEDLGRIKYIKRLFRKYQKNGVLRERLILNHIIIMYNVFGIRAATRILFFKIDQEHHSLLKTFLVFLNYLPESDIPEIQLIRVSLDKDIINRLRDL